MKFQEKASLREMQKELADVRKKAEEKPEPEAKDEGEKTDPAMAKMLEALAKTQADLLKVMSAPRQTKIIEDEKGRAIGAVSTVSNAKE